MTFLLQMPRKYIAFIKGKATTCRDTGLSSSTVVTI